VVGGRWGGECGRAASARNVRDEVGNMVRLAAYQNLVATRGLKLMTKESGEASHSQHPH
jgi:hypothetical protein